LFDKEFIFVQEKVDYCASQLYSNISMMRRSLKINELDKDGNKLCDMCQ